MNGLVITNSQTLTHAQPSTRLSAPSLNKPELRLANAGTRTGEPEDSRMDGHDRDWRDYAACRGEDPELFFPIGTTGPALRQIEEAKTICARCPVLRQCLSFAMETGQDYGIWGGLTADERRSLRRRNQRSHRM